MDQGPKDQNSETRDFSAADEGDDHDNVNLVDMEVELQNEDEIHSSANFLGGALDSWIRQTSICKHSGSRCDKQKEYSMQPKRVLKPSMKLITNRLQTDTLKHERL